MIALFTRHPQSVGETYFEHLGMAAGFASSLLAAAIVCGIHAILPFMFEKTGSRMIADLYQRTGPGRKKGHGTSQLVENA